MAVCVLAAFEDLNINLCVGSITMVMTLIVMAMAVCGGLCVGTIAFSAYKFAELDKALDLFQKIDIIHLA